ncbi:c6 zinc finger domain containing protein [Stemphylium lycopersici]|nr:c6 zinc finger domain containing protein [Stemphylium lycopersici]
MYYCLACDYPQLPPHSFSRATLSDLDRFDDDLECEQPEDTSTWITHIDPTPNEVDQDAPLLVDIFKLRMNDLDLPEEPPSIQSYIPGNSISPAGSAEQSVSKRKIRLTSESAFLLQTYVRTVATWMDIFDHGSTYQHKIPQLVLASPLLFHCVCAFTANHLALSNSSHNPSWEVCAVRHYGKALRLLIEALGVPSHEHALTGSMLLLSYEIQGAQRSEDYRRHFLGLTSLIKSRRVTAQSTGTDLANFWIYVRHEIVVAMASEQPLVFDPAEWEVSWIEGETREDILGNHVLWILARVINLVFGPDGNTDAGKIQRQNFLQEIEIWRRGLSETFVGIGYGEQDEDGFRKVYFPVTAAAAAAFWYHIVHILLYAEPVLQDEAYIPLIQEQAVKITDIAISEFPPSLMVFSTHGLFYGISRKARIWNVLNDVETQTGYNTRQTNVMEPLPDSQDERAAIVDAFIKRRKTVQGAWEALGLTSTTSDKRSAKFFENEPNMLQTKVEQLAKSFLADFRGNLDQLHTDLTEKPWFSEKVSTLGQQYGAKIWGHLQNGEIRSSSESQGKPDWDVPNGREYNSGSWNVLFRAPEPPRMFPTLESPQEAAGAVRTDEDIRNPNGGLASAATLKASETTSKKRKAIDGHERIPSGKLPIPSKAARPISAHHQGQHRDLYSIPPSPKPPSALDNLIIEARGFRLGTQDTDRTWFPRETTVDTATIVGDGDIPAREMDLILQSDIAIASKESLQYEYHDHPVAGPSGTYRKPTRRDSVFPSDTQPLDQIEQANKELPHRSAILIEQLTGDSSSDAINRSTIQHRSDPTASQQLEYRRELFKLLVAYLNGIEQFSNNAYDFSAEERMNMLLNQFWINDTEALQAALGDDACRLRIALESWMSMRYRLSQFRSTTGYFGRPREEWIEYLRRMDDVSSARAMLAFVDLQGSARKEGECGYVAEMFDVDLTVVFDALTKVKGCNGSEAFRGVRRFNDALLEWFDNDEV